MHAPDLCLAGDEGELRLMSPDPEAEPGETLARGVLSVFADGFWAGFAAPLPGGAASESLDTDCVSAVSTPTDLLSLRVGSGVQRLRGPIPAPTSALHADVACQQLGFLRVEAVWDEAYGERDLPGLISNVSCNGSEAFLDACEFNVVPQAARLDEFE